MNRLNQQGFQRGQRVAFTLESPLYQAGYRTGVVVEMRSMVEAIDMKAAAGWDEAKLDETRAVLDATDPAMILPIVRTESGFEVPCAVEWLEAIDAAPEMN